MASPLTVGLRPNHLDAPAFPNTVLKCAGLDTAPKNATHSEDITITFFEGNRIALLLCPVLGSMKFLTNVHETPAARPSWPPRPGTNSRLYILLPAGRSFNFSTNLSRAIRGPRRCSAAASLCKEAAVRKAFWYNPSITPPVAWRSAAAAAS